MKFDSELQPQGKYRTLVELKEVSLTFATSAGAMLLWVNQRSEFQSNEGVYVQSLDENGAANGDVLAVNGSFVHYLLGKMALATISPQRATKTLDTL